MSAISRNHARNFVLILCAGLVWMPGAVRPAVAQDLAGDDRDKSLSEYTKGVFLLESGSPEEALPYLEAAWRHSGHDARIGEKLADTYFRLGKLGSCGQVIDELLAANEKDPAALLLKAKIHYIKGERVDALQYLRTLKTVAKPSFDAERLFAKVLFELGRDEEALQAYGDAIALDPYYPFLHYTYGLLLQKFHKTDEAQEAMQEALRLEPRFTEAALELAAMMIEDQKFSKAEEVLETLLEEEIDSSEAVLMLANLYFDQGKLDKAIRRLEETAQGSKLTREGLLLLGRLYYEAKDYDEAFTVFENVFEKETRTPEMARVLGEISLKAGKHDQALKFYRVAIEMGPQDYRNYIALFFATSSRFGGGDSPTLTLADDEIVDLLERAAKVVEPDDFEAIYLLGVSYQSLEEFAQAREYLIKALDLRPDDERTLLNLGAVLEKMKRYDEAERHVIALHKRKPEDATICNFYGYLLALMGKELDKAETLVRTALKNEPDNGYYTDSLGWVYYRRGDYALAVIELEKASGLVGDDPVILEHLGDAYQSLKRYREALAAYQKSLDLQGSNSEVLGKISTTRERLGN